MLPFRKRLSGWFIARLPRESTCTLNQRRIYLLPTRFGLSLIVVALAVWVGALNYAVSLAYALAFWIAALLLVAVLMAYRQLAGLTLSGVRSEPVFAGDAASCRIRLSHEQALERRLCLQRADGEGDIVDCALAPAASLDVGIPQVLAWRGAHPYPDLRVWSEAPFGLIRAFAYVRLDGALLAYPVPLADRDRNDHQEGREPSAAPRPTERDEFSHLSEYQQGDTPRQIAWTVLARRDVLVSKRFAGEPAGAGLRVIAWQDYPAGVDVESRLSRLCWRVLQCERSGQSYCLLLPGARIDPRPFQKEAALSALAAYDGGQPA